MGSRKEVKSNKFPAGADQPLAEKVKSLLGHRYLGLRTNMNLEFCSASWRIEICNFI
ncbi:MAG: hypothetical protein ABH830_02125 [Patescibacteria group bacterium]